MKRCNKCSLIMGDGAEVCASCGQSLEKDFTYICNNCGQVDFSGAQKCSRCGLPTIFAKAKYQNLISTKEKLAEFAGHVKEAGKTISVNEYKAKSGKILTSLKEKARNLPVDEYKDKAGHAYDSAKGVVSEIPVDELKNRVGKVINSAKDAVSGIPVDECKEKVGQAYNSIKETASNVSANEVKDKDGHAYDSAKCSVSETLVDESEGKAEQAYNSIKETASNTYAKDCKVETEKGRGLENKESHENIIKEKNFFSKYKQFVFGVVTVIVLFGVYQLGVHSTTKKDAENTSEKAITSVKPSSKTVNPNESSKHTIDKSAEGKAYAARLLKKYGINSQVLATSYGNNGAGLVALLYDGSEDDHIAIIDKRNDRVGIANIDESLAYMENNARGLVEVNIIILNDTKDADKDSGIWQGTNHLFPIRVQYKRRNDGQIEPGMIKTCYKNSMKYDQYLQESKNVDIVNLLLTEWPVMMKNFNKEQQVK